MCSVATLAGIPREPPRQPRQKTSGLPPLLRKEGCFFVDSLFRNAKKVVDEIVTAIRGYSQVRILTSKFFSRLSLVGISLTFLACSQNPLSNPSPSTPSPESLKPPSPTAETTPIPFDPKLDIGVVVAGPECSELFIRNKELKSDDEIQVVQADDLPHKKLLARVIGPNGCPRNVQSGIEEIVLNGDDSTPNEYEIRFADGNDPGSGFAVTSAKARVEIRKGVANLTATNVATPLLFRVCSGNESYHMTVWNGKPLVGKRVWYSYMSLSYDTVPTCKPADFK